MGPISQYQCANSLCKPDIWERPNSHIKHRIADAYGELVGFRGFQCTLTTIRPMWVRSGGSTWMETQAKTLRKNNRPSLVCTKHTDSQFQYRTCITVHIGGYKTPIHMYIENPWNRGCSVSSWDLTREGGNVIIIIIHMWDHVVLE